MKRFLASPFVNAACISLFTAFYASIFFITAKSAEFDNNLYYKESASLWSIWSRFLANGSQKYIAYGLIAVTILIIVLLVMRRRPYDEYHASILAHCLVVAVVLTMVAIALFYLMILNDPSGIVEKFTLFIVIHWSTVVLADLTYVLICRWR